MMTLIYSYKNNRKHVIKNGKVWDFFQSFTLKSEIICFSNIVYQRTQQIEVLQDQTGPNGPEPDLPEKECDRMVQKTSQNLTMLNIYVWFVFVSLSLSFYKV